jgi:hypothetical protein
MDSPQSLHILRNELLRRGLPREYVERVTGELADHADDLAAEASRAAPAAATSAMQPPLAERLGDPVRLADGLSREFQRRTFLGRHPWLTFVALPVGAMLTAWVATNLIILLLVELVLRMGGVIPSDACCWVAAVVAGTLAYGMTYGMPVVVGWWALRKARQTTRAWSWVWATTTALVLASFVFRISIYRLDDGRFVIDDSSVPLRYALTVLLSEERLPTDWTFWRCMLAGSFSFAYLGQLAFLIGATAVAIRRFRRALATLVSTDPAEKATA